jgi:hypothetical protein
LQSGFVGHRRVNSRSRGFGFLRCGLSRRRYGGRGWVALCNG